MSMPTYKPEHFADLTHSFAALKESALTLDDIARWFGSHPALLPNLPGLYTEQVDVSLEAQAGGPVINFNDPTLYYEIVLRYPVPERGPQSRVLRAIIHGTPCEHKKGEYEWRTYTLPLPIEDWPLLCAHVAFRVLQLAHFQKHPLQKFALATPRLWNTHFVKPDWDTVVGMYNTGLLPDDADSFAAWALQVGQAPMHAQTTPALPDTMI